MIAGFATSSTLHSGMLLICEVLALMRKPASAASRRYSRHRPSPTPFLTSARLLLSLVAFYLVASRLGPVVTRVGESAVVRFELGPQLVAEEDVPALLRLYARIRDFTRAPGPFVLFGRSTCSSGRLRLSSSKNRLTNTVQLKPTMGNRSSTKSFKPEEHPRDAPPPQPQAADDTPQSQPQATDDAPQSHPQAAGGPLPPTWPEPDQEEEDIATKSQPQAADDASQPQPQAAGGPLPPTWPEPDQEEEDDIGPEPIREKAGPVSSTPPLPQEESPRNDPPAQLEALAASSCGEREVPHSFGRVTSDPILRLKQAERKESESSIMFSDDEADDIDAFFERAARKAGSKPVKLVTLERKISTGDVALLYRVGQPTPHLAVFIQNEPCDPNFPLLLVKGKTKPLPLEQFNPKSGRFAHPVTAATRIFYGDYERVVIRHLRQSSAQIPLCSEAMKLVDSIQRIPFTEDEEGVIKSATTDGERSALVCMFMVAHFYSLLGVFEGEPSTVRPETLLEVLDLTDPISIKLPPVKPGPLKSGDPPLLAKLVDGIRPSEDVPLTPFASVLDNLKTGDLVLFSGATSSGAIIKFFDNSQFSHVGLVLKMPFTSQVLVWEASTNKAGLVDIDTSNVRKGVEMIPLQHKIFSGWYDRVAIRHLTGITDEQRRDIYQHLLQFRQEVQGRPYEKSTIELILSSMKVEEGFLSFLRNEHEDLSSIFCSEFVAAAYQRAGLLPRTGRPSNDYTPDDFSSAKGMTLEFGELEPEVYIELKFDFAPGYLAQESVY